MALTLAGLTVLVFLMLRLIPGTVVEQMIGADAVASPAMVAQLKAFFGLDQPWYLQYGRWIGRLVQGDLGISWRTAFGLINIDLTPFVIKQPFDQTQIFRFGFGTRF